MTADARTDPPRLPAWWARVLAASILALALAGLVFYRHARVWMRSAPPVPNCARAAGRSLRIRELVSGYEPHDTESGATAYLTSGEDVAVRCSGMLSASLPPRLTTAFAEIDPDRRREALLALARSTPLDAARDAEAYVIDLAAGPALEALPKTQANRDAVAEVDRLEACRFYGSGFCATRPSIPLLVWLFGVPGALGLLSVAGFAARVGVVRAWRWRRRRRVHQRVRKAA